MNRGNLKKLQSGIRRQRSEVFVPANNSMVFGHPFIANYHLNSRETTHS